MSFEFVLRLIGMVVLSLAGLRLGIQLADVAGEAREVWAMVVSLIGALFGLILTPHITTRPARAIRDYLSKMPAQQLVASVVGLIIGLIIAALISLPLSALPPPYNGIMPVVAAIVFGYFGTSIMAMRRRDIFELFQMQLPRFNLGGQEADNGIHHTREILLDTSVIIDGRIADVSRTGFVMGKMLVPRFILNELQHIADSPDVMRRNRGRRGLEILNRLQQESLAPVEITDLDSPEVGEVDEKLVLLAKRLNCAIVTNDFNLNRVAELQGVLVLNINDLANAVKTVFLPGEEMDIHIIQEGKELGQGVGYLDDGTMVVIEGGRRHMNETIPVTVTKVLQTSAGRMIFARPEPHRDR